MAFRLFGRKKKRWEGERPDETPVPENERTDGSSIPEERREEMPEERVTLEKENVDLTNKTLRMDYIQRLYEGIKEAKRQCEGVKSEYGQVTSHLKDIQLMDQAPDEEKEVLMETAGTIVELTREREDLKRRE